VTHIPGLSFTWLHGPYVEQIKIIDVHVVVKKRFIIIAFARSEQHNVHHDHNAGK
jgi:hypothetical protein